MKRHDLPPAVWRKPLAVWAKLIRKFRSLNEWIVQTDYKCRMKRCGTDVWINRGTILEGLGHLSVGNHVYIGPNCLFYAADAELTIEDYVTFGPHVTIVTGNHRMDEIGEWIRYSQKPAGEGNACDAPVHIGADVWIGANATILKGEDIARGSVIGAGAVVTGNTVPYGVYAGVPAKLIRLRFPEEVQKEHERMLCEKYRYTFD